MSIAHELEPQIDGEYIEGRIAEAMAAVDELAARPGNDMSMYRVRQAPYILERAYLAGPDEVAPENLWMASANYIAKLESLPAQVYDECAAEQQVLKLTEQMVSSLARAELNQANLPQYIEALKFIFKGNTYVGKAEAATILRRRHSEVSGLATRSSEAYRRLLGAPDFYENLGDFFMQSKNLESDKFLEDKQFFNQVLNAAGVADESTIDALNWNKHEPPELFTGELFANMAAIEKQRPGGLKLLHDFYGVRAFNRYPPSLLIEQIDTHGKANRPYGVLASAVADHNGFLAKAPAIHGNHAYDVRVVEADSSVDMARRLVNLHRLYGDRQRISFAILQAHGGSDGYLLGNHLVPELARVNIGNLHHKSDEHGLKRFFVERPSLAYFACEPEEGEGQAVALSRALETDVIAPNGPTYRVDKLVYLANHGGLSLTTNLDNPVLYRNGQRISIKASQPMQAHRRLFGLRRAA